MRRKILAIIVICLMIVSFSINVFSDNEIPNNDVNSVNNTNTVDTNTLQQQKQNIDTQLNNSNNQLQGVQSELSTTLQNIEQLDDSLEKYTNQYNDLQGKIATGEQQINETNARLQDEQDEYNRKEKVLKKRVVALYEAGDTTYIDVLLSSKNLVDFLSNYFLIGELVEYDSNLLNQIEYTKNQIKQTKNQQEKQQDDLKIARQQINQTKIILSNDSILKQNYIITLSEQEKTIEAQITQYKLEEKQIENQMQKFIWPCDNKMVTSGMKRRWGRWHKGIDIAANFENIYASASGIAFNASNPGGYGSYIIIIHGNGYITLYGHLSATDITDGQYVEQGQVIATSGASGDATGPHLHFEIRKASSLTDFFGDNNWLNPLDYLPTGYIVEPGALTETDSQSNDTNNNNNTNNTDNTNNIANTTDNNVVNDIGNPMD